MTEYTLKRAVIESARKVFLKDEPGNNFICRIIPDMIGLGPVDQLPRFPSFFADKQENYAIGDVVWVLTVQDFQLGYVLGLAETPTGSKNSAVFLRINEVEKDAGLVESSPQDLAFEQRQTSSIDFYNRKNQQSGRIYNTGTVFLYGADGSFHMKQFDTSVTVSQKGEISVTGKILNTEFEKENTIVHDTYKEDVGSKELDVLGTLKENIGGEMSSNVAGSVTKHVVGNLSETTIGQRVQLDGGGIDETIVLGNHTEKIIAGNHSEMILAGTYSVTVVAGAITISAPAINISGLSINLTAGMTKINGPMTLPIGAVVPSFIPGFNCLPVCPLTGLPHGGQMLVGI